MEYTQKYSGCTRGKNIHEMFTGDGTVAGLDPPFFTVPEIGHDGVRQPEPGLRDKVGVIEDLPGPALGIRGNKVYIRNMFR